MFKKTLLALALTATTSTAFAATITPGIDILSRQAIASDANVELLTTVGAAGISTALAAEYAVGDVITITLTGATIDKAASTPVLTDGTNAITLGVLTTEANVMTFRVTGITATTVGVALVLTGVELDTASVVASETVNMAFSAETSGGLALDTSDTAKVLAVVDEYATSITTALDGIINVNKSRQEFAPDAVDVLVLTPAVANTLAEATYVGSTYTVIGDFSFLDTDGNGTLSGSEIANAAVTVTDDSFTRTINAAMDTLTVVTTEGGTDGPNAVTVTFTVAGEGATNPVLKVQDFTANSAIRYTDTVGTAGSLTTKTAEDAGSFTINGAQINFPYAPVGYDNIVTQFEIANSGLQNAEISVSAFDTAGIVHNAVLPQVAEAGKLTKIGFADLTTAFGLTTGTKLSVTFTVAAPAGDIKITGYSNLNNAGRMALLSDAYEGIE